MFTNKDLWRLIWPLIVERFLAIALGIADIIMVGSLGEAAVSGVSLVDSVFVLIEQVFAALATGGAVVCSQYIGRKDAKMASQTAKQLIYSVLLFSLLIMVIGFVGHRRLLLAIFGVVDSDVMNNAMKYFFYMLIGLPSVGLFNGCSALFRAQRNSKISMLTSVLVNVINISGNAIFLFGLKMGVEGVAIPTFVARTVAAVLLLYLLRKDSKNESALHVIDIRGLHKVKFDFLLIKRILQVGIPAGLENAIFQVGKLLVLSLMASFGTAAIAANAAANTIGSFEVIPASAIGVGMLTIVGQCMGAGKPDEAAKFTGKLMKIAYISLIAINFPLLFALPKLLSFYGLSAEATDLALKMLVLHGVLCMVFWPMSFSLPNALRAANDGKFTMTVSIVTMWTVRIGLSYVLAKVTSYGAFSVWIAMMADWIVRGAFFGIRFKKGAWRRKKLI